MNALLQKILLPAVIFLAGAVTMAIVDRYMEKDVVIPPVPDCICPEPSVQVQPFEVDKIKGLKTFHYAPQFSGSIEVAGVDREAIKKMISESVNEALGKK